MNFGFYEVILLKLVKHTLNFENEDRSIRSTAHTLVLVGANAQKRCRNCAGEHVLWWHIGRTSTTTCFPTFFIGRLHCVCAAPWNNVPGCWKPKGISRDFWLWRLAFSADPSPTCQQSTSVHMNWNISSGDLSKSGSLLKLQLSGSNWVNPQKRREGYWSFFLIRNLKNQPSRD